MELARVLESSGTCRYYRPDPIPPDVLRRVLDGARWAPSGGNRQPVRLVVVQQRATKQALQELYRPRWEAYAAPVLEALERSGAALPKVLAGADHMARHLVEIPALIVVCFRVADVLATDLDLGRVSVVAGASIYPAVQNLLLTARDEGLGAALTTLLCADEARVKSLLGIPDGFGTAALLTLGWPERPFPRKLGRRPLGEMAFGERFGEPLGE
jgi:nitroreductase